MQTQHLLIVLGDHKEVILTCDESIVPGVHTVEQAWDWIATNAPGQPSTWHITAPHVFVTRYVQAKGVLCMGCQFVDPSRRPGSIEECKLLHSRPAAPITSCPALPRNRHPLHAGE